MNISEPIKVETPKQISALDAAKIALRADGSKYAHLSPRQAALLAEHIDRLEAEHINRLKEVRNLKIWSGIEISRPQPFWMEPEK